MPRPGTIETGTMFAGDFRVIRPLGEGGMGSVYVVEQLSTGSERALKVMHEHLLTDDKLRGRFVQEARVGARIRSDHIVQVIAAGIHDDSGAPWLVMELLEGRDLASFVRDRGILPLAEVREICAQLCHALAAAHQVGVVHRDLKPENVFLADSRREGTPVTVKVLDFGIAKILSEASPNSTTSAIGTPLWMAPEQTDTAASIGPGTDVWALGLMVFWMLTGKPYWRVANGQCTSAMALMREVVFEPLSAASERAAELGVGERLPAGFDPWFARCVTRDAQQRFRDAADARPGLLSVLGWESSLSSTAPAVVPLTVTPARAPGGVHSPLIAVTPPAAAAAPDLVTAPTELLAPSSSAQFPTGRAVSESLAPPHEERARRGSRAFLLGGAALALVIVVGAAIGARRMSAARGQQAQCDAGVARACAGLALEQEQTRTTRGLERALHYYQRACDLGDWSGCFRLGMMLQANEGIARDDARAVAAFDRACTGGEATACRTLATMYAAGEGVSRSEARAVVLWVRACELGQAEACTRAGEMFRDGSGAVPDPDRARELFARGCFGRDSRACERQRELEGR